MQWPSVGQWRQLDRPDFPINILRHTIKCAVLCVQFSVYIQFNGVDWFITAEFEAIRINYSISGGVGGRINGSHSSSRGRRNENKTNEEEGK